MSASNAEVYAIILAAGASQRLGQPKQLLEWRNRSLLAHAITTADSVLRERTIVVLGANAEAINNGIDLDGTVAIINPDWQEGMASSIRAGIQALPPSATAALILLCDQPLVKQAHLQMLLNAWQTAPTKIVASLYRQSPGVPALFPREFFGDLSALAGDRGAKPLLQKFESRLLKIPMPEAELDIDYDEDFARLAGLDDALSGYGI